MTIFGPNKYGHYYITTYHSKTAAVRPHKSQWCVSANQEYQVFNLAHEHDFGHVSNISADPELDYIWMNDDFRGLIGFLSNTERGKIILQCLGKNDERFAFFPKITNLTDLWHGYPISSDKIGRNLAKYWKDKGLISPIDYTRVLRHQI